MNSCLEHTWEHPLLILSLFIMALVKIIGSWETMHTFPPVGAAITGWLANSQSVCSERRLWPPGSESYLLYQTYSSLSGRCYTVKHVTYVAILIGVFLPGKRDPGGAGEMAPLVESSCCSSRRLGFWFAAPTVAHTHLYFNCQASDTLFWPWAPGMQGVRTHTHKRFTASESCYWVWLRSIHLRARPLRWLMKQCWQAQWWCRSC